MRMIDELGSPDQQHGLDDFVTAANRLLPRHLPELTGDADARMRQEVNVRLVRHLTTLGLLDEPLRAGREARYTRRHLLQLLVVRRLMAEGYTTGAIKKLTFGADDDALVALLEGARPQMPDNPALVHHAAAQDISHEELAQDVADPRDPGEANPALNFLLKVRERSGAHGKGTPVSAPAPAHAPPSPAPTALTSPASPPSWVRVEVDPGLEVHVREDYVPPATTYEREKLWQKILQSLKQLHGPKRRKR